MLMSLNRRLQLPPLHFDMVGKMLAAKTVSLGKSVDCTGVKNLEWHATHTGEKNEITSVLQRASEQMRILRLNIIFCLIGNTLLLIWDSNMQNLSKVRKKMKKTTHALTCAQTKGRQRQMQSNNLQEDTQLLFYHLKVVKQQSTSIVFEMWVHWRRLFRFCFI